MRARLNPSKLDDALVGLLKLNKRSCQPYSASFHASVSQGRHRSKAMHESGAKVGRGEGGEEDTFSSFLSSALRADKMEDAPRALC